MATLNKYRIKCNTDDIYEYVWAETVPTTCPTNTGHTIDSNSIAIVESISDTDVRMHEGEGSYEKKYRTKGFKMNISSGTVNAWQYSDAFSFPYDILLGNAELYFTDKHNKNDIIEFVIAKETIVGTTSADMTSGTATCDIGGASAYFKIGQFISIGSDDFYTLGEVVNISGTVVTTQNNATTTHVSGSLVKLTDKMADTIYPPCLSNGAAVPSQIGLGWIGGSVIPADTPLQTAYYNTEAIDKTLTWTLEYKFSTT